MTAPEAGAYLGAQAGAHAETPGGVPSPCVNICRMNDATGWCEGCHRTLDEIAFWSVLDEGDKQAVWALLLARRQQLPALPADPGAGTGCGSPGSERGA